MEKDILQIKDELGHLQNTLETASHLQDLMIDTYYEEEVYPDIESLKQNRKDSGIVAYAVMDYLAKASEQLRSVFELVGVSQ